MDNISLVTYAGQTVTPLDDALVYETAINQSGMIYGGTVTIKSANNLHISSGHGIVCGRKFTIFDSDIQVALSSSGTLLGRLYVQLDLSNVGTPIQLLVETGASLTPVQQDNNVNIMNGVFEFNIATFTVDTSTISNVIMVAPSAEPSTGAGSVITVTTAEASLAGKMCTITDGTTTLNANFDNTGKAVFYGVQMVGRVLVNATDGEYYASGEVNITYFGLYSTSIAFWGATINLSTTTPEFYGQNITVEQDGILVSTISFDGTGHATYIAPALGVYDFTVTYGGNEYTATVNVTEETTYSKSIDIAPAGLDLSAWITAGSTTDYPLNPSSYADFSALEADEAAVRQLMLVHDAVDYLATASAGDTLMQSVINSDVCAKWINLSDYALDTLSANTDIKSVMDTADKYGYGEWGITDSTTTPSTWGALGTVPIMTANNAPYGTAIANSETGAGAAAYIAFNGNKNLIQNNRWTGYIDANNTYLGFHFVNPVNVKRFSYIQAENAFSDMRDDTVHIEYSLDGTTWTTLSQAYSFKASEATTEKTENVETDVFAPYWAVKFTNGNFNAGTPLAMLLYLQFYGRELKPLVPTMTSNTAPKGEAFDNPSNANTSFAAFKAFDGDGSTRWSSRGDATSAYLGYDFGEPTLIRGVEFVEQDTHNYTLTIKGSNDKSTWVDVGSPISVTGVANKKYNYSADGITKYRYWALFFTGITSGESLYTAQFYGMNYSEKEFAQGSTRKTIYDHGVELETLTGTSGVEKNNDNIYIPTANGISTPSIDMTPFDMVGIVVGKRILVSSSGSYIGIGTETAGQANAASYSSGFSRIAGQDMPYNVAHAISSISESKTVTITSASGVSDYLTIDEIWLE